MILVLEKLLLVQMYYYIKVILFLKLVATIRTDEVFYVQSIDHIEVLDVNQFKENVLNSHRATFIEYYAHWCGYSKNFRPHWKNFANETKLWHKNVLRVAAMDCADDKNEICLTNRVFEYPQFKVLLKFYILF